MRDGAEIEGAGPTTSTEFDRTSALLGPCGAILAIMRFFNTAGPVVANDHYSIPPLERLNLGEIRTLVRDKQYFVLHAPRQTGKTSALLALRDLLNSGAEGDFRCVYVNVEAGQASREDVGQAMRAILYELEISARTSKKPPIQSRSAYTHPVLWTDAAARRRPRPAGRGTARGQRFALPPARPTRGPPAHSPRRLRNRSGPAKSPAQATPAIDNTETTPRNRLGSSLAPRRPRRHNHCEQPGPGG